MEIMEDEKLEVMPCGSRWSCIKCRYFTSATNPCTYIKRMTEKEYEVFNKKLYSK